MAILAVGLRIDIVAEEVKAVGKKACMHPFQTSKCYLYDGKRLHYGSNQRPSSGYRKICRVN